MYQDGGETAGKIDWKIPLNYYECVMKRIKIRSSGIEIFANLFETPTADALWEALPIEGTAQRWGGEIYFDIPIELELEPESRATVRMGEIGYWPRGRAMCVFFGMTPISEENEIRAASPVNVFGRIEGNPERLKWVAEGEAITVERDSE